MNGPTNILLGDVRVLDEAGSRAEAIAWRNGSIVAVGTRAEVHALAGADTNVIDPGGATILPGFIDPHHHASIVALYGGAARLEPPAVRDIESLQRVLADASTASSRDDEWLVAMDWDEGLLSERRAPTRAELDDAVPDRPLFALHYSCHRAVVNSRALELAGIGRASPDPAGGAIGRGRDGLPNGLLIERAMSPCEQRARASLIARDADGFFARLARHYRELLATGVTRIADATVPGDLVTLYREAERRGAVLVPTVIMPVSTTGYLEMPWDALEGPVTGTEEGQLSFGPVKLVFDGAPGCAMCLSWWQLAGVMIRTWAMTIAQHSLDPLRNTLSLEPLVGLKIRTGIQMYRPSDADPIIRAAIDRGFSLATHAIGNEAIEIALSGYEAAANLDRAGIPRLEHAAFLSMDLVERIAGVGAAVVVQPFFMSLPSYANAPSIPRVRNSPVRWLLDHGVKVAGSSDFPVAGFDPLDGVRAAVQRRTSGGKTYEADQCIELDEALAMYTRTAAEVIGAADRTGTLEVGKRADLVVLDAPLSPSALKTARVRATVLAGEVVFGSLDPPCETDSSH